MGHTFEVLEEGHERHQFEDYAPGGKAGRGDVRWYVFQEGMIGGVAKDQDLREASMQELAAFYYANRTARAVAAGSEGAGSAYVSPRPRGRGAD